MLWTVLFDIAGSEDSADDSESKEFFIATHYDTVEEALKLFADDELLSKPGKRPVSVTVFVLSGD